jgi:hypothetical protein
MMLMRYRHVVLSRETNVIKRWMYINNRYISPLDISVIDIHPSLYHIALI